MFTFIKGQIAMFFLLYEFCFWYPYPEKASYFHFDCKFSSAEGYLISAVVFSREDKFKESERLGWVTMTASSSTMENASHMVCTFSYWKDWYLKAWIPNIISIYFLWALDINPFNRKKVYTICVEIIHHNILFLCFFVSLFILALQCAA